jgi:hypothetical protein
MAIVSTDLKFYLSGGGSNTDPNASLGGVISSTQVGSNLFDDIGTAEAASGDTEYRAYFVKNTNASNTVATATSMQIAVCDEGVGNTIETVGNESTAPTGPTFDDAEDEANALTIGNLTPGQAFGIWVKRVVASTTTAFPNDTATLRVKANTAA